MYLSEGDARGRDGTIRRAMFRYGGGGSGSVRWKVAVVQDWGAGWGRAGQVYVQYLQCRSGR